MEQLRRSYITLHLAPAVAVGVGLATLIATFPMRVVSAQVVASDSGVGAGATTVVVRKNGVAISTLAPLSIPQGAATLATSEGFIGAPNNYPGGEGAIKGDILTVDVTAVPATTSPKSVSVILSIVQTDV